SSPVSSTIVTTREFARQPERPDCQGEDERMRKSVRVLLLGAALSVATLVSAQGAEAEQNTVRAAMEAVGTFSWVVHGMDYFGTAEANGITVVGTPYASKQATEIALRGNEADVKVDDFLGPVLLRDAGIMVSGIYP